MTTVIQSRFAGLSIEDDDYAESSQSQKKAKNAVASAKKTETQKKKKTTTSTTAAKKKNKKALASDDQWQKWKQKDEEIVDEAYEAELTQAILLSKIEFEQHKNVIKITKKQNEVDKKTPELVNTSKEQKTQKKQKKKNVMSLGQFNDMVSGDDNKKAEEVQTEVEEQSAPPEDPKFFDRLSDEVQQELRRDKYKENVLQRQQLSDEIINRVQFAEVLERKDKEIDKLHEEVSRLKEELLTVKTRNKKLCNILGQGEMRDKAEALVELEKLRQVQSELTAEVASLHAQLEQERSKSDKQKDKKKKEK